jgi:hypothetical protein
MTGAAVAVKYVGARSTVSLVVSKKERDVAPNKLRCFEDWKNQKFNTLPLFLFLHDGFCSAPEKDSLDCRPLDSKSALILWR